MPEITIDGKPYDAQPLSEAARINYWQYIDDLAETVINPHEELYRRVCQLPEHLQQVAFQSVPHSIRPLNERELRRVCTQPDAVRTLLAFATPEPPAITDQQAIAVFLQLCDAIGDSLIEAGYEQAPPAAGAGEQQTQTLSGQAAAEAAQKWMAKQKAS